MSSRSIKQLLQCKSTIKYVIDFTVEVKEVVENLNEGCRALRRWSLVRSPV